MNATLGTQSGTEICADTETVWLTPRERRAWLALTGVMIKLPSMLDGQLGRDSAMSFYEYMVLAMLSEAEGQRLRMSRLSVLTSGSLSRLSHVVKRLEADGYVARETDLNDRRSTNAILTEAGLRKVTESAPGHVCAVRRLVFDALTSEQIDQLGQIGEALMTTIDPEGITQPPSRA